MKATIGIFGSHSAEEVGMAAKDWGFQTVIVCEEGRERLYVNYNRHLYDHFLILDKFEHLIWEENQEKLKELDTIFIPNRSFAVYVGYDNIEKKFEIPLYGNRNILRIEDPNQPKNQYWLMKEGNIRHPKQYTPDTIDTLVIVKTHQADRPLERAFFFADSPDSFEKNSKELIKKGVISEEELENCVIEEYVLGPRFNANFQAYQLHEFFDRFDFVGFDDRIQTNLAGWLNLPACYQLMIQDVPIKNEEMGHFGVTMRESRKILVYDAAEQFLDAVEKYFPPGMIGLFSLQGAVNENNEFVIFDISPRVPGSPCVGPTSPEMRRLRLKYRRRIESPLDLSMMEIAKALELDRIDEITT